VSGPSEKFWQQVLAAAEALDTRSYYELLNVDARADGDAVSQAYYKLAKVIHPDRHARERDGKRLKALTLLYARLGEAYRVLSMPELRKTYDAALAQGQKRLPPEAVGKERELQDQRDPNTERGRQLFARSQEMVVARDYRGARAQLELARQLEPESPAIQRAITDLDERDRKRQSLPLPPDAGDKGPSPSDARADGAAPGPARQVAAQAAAQAATLLDPPSDFARDHTRHPVVRPVKIKCGSWKVFETFYTRDISRGGMFLRTSQPLAAGIAVDVVLSLPDGQTVTLAAEVAHSAEKPEHGRPAGMGLRFLAIDEETRAELNRLMATRPIETSAGIVAGAATGNGENESEVLHELLERLANLRDASDRDVLGVPTDADPDVIRKAYLQLAKRYHPDLYGRFRGAAVADAVNEAFVLVRTAYKRLVRGEGTSGKTRTPSVGSGADAVAGAADIEVIPHNAPPRPQAAGQPLPTRRLLDEDLFDEATLRRTGGHAAAVPSADVATVPSAGTSARPAAVPSARPAAASAVPAARAPVAPAKHARSTPPVRASKPLSADELFDDDTLGASDEPPPAELDELSHKQLARDGRDALKQGRFAEARELLQKSLDADPRDRYIRATYHLAAGYEARAAGRDEDAKKQFETVLLFDKQCEEAIQELRAPAKEEKSAAKKLTDWSASPVLGRLFRKREED
jgi:uncharacterized protein (TIGR02266 family)